LALLESVLLQLIALLPQAGIRQRAESCWIGCPWTKLLSQGIAGLSLLLSSDNLLFTQPLVLRVSGKLISETLALLKLIKWHSVTL
jgi:hypothetical protein